MTRPLSLHGTLPAGQTNGTFDTANLTLAWSSLALNLSAPSVTDTATACVFASPCLSMTMTECVCPLTLLAGAVPLLPTPFDLTLTASNPFGSSHVTIAVLPDAPPYAGSCSLSPPLGNPTTDLFFVNCSGWLTHNSNSSVSFSYIFSLFLPPNNTTTSQLLPLAGAGTTLSPAQLKVSRVRSLVRQWLVRVPVDRMMVFL